MFPCLPLRVKICLARQVRQSIPSRVSLLILYTPAESGAYSQEDFSRFPRRRRLFSFIVHNHRVSPEFTRACKYVPISFTTEGRRRRRVSSPQGSSSNDAAFSGVTIDHFLCASPFLYLILVRHNHILFCSYLTYGRWALAC